MSTYALATIYVLLRLCDQCSLSLSLSPISPHRSACPCFVKQRGRIYRFRAARELEEDRTVVPSLLQLFWKCLFFCRSV